MPGLDPSLDWRRANTTNVTNPKNVMAFSMTCFTLTKTIENLKSNKGLMSWNVGVSLVESKYHTPKNDKFELSHFKV